jgi:hypothetical protein
MSALPPIADIRECIEHVCFVPEADITAMMEAVRLRARSGVGELAKQEAIAP